MRRFVQGRIRHNLLRSACGTYSGSPLHYALHLKDSHYEVREARTSVKQRGCPVLGPQFITHENRKNRFFQLSGSPLKLSNPWNEASGRTAAM
jgi:hypothetical protein